MEIKYHRFNATELWTVSALENPEVASKMNLSLQNIPNNLMTGFGIYALSFKDESCVDRVIYVGKYAGKAPHANYGDPRSRWVQHIETATLLLHNNLKMDSYEYYFHHLFEARRFFASDTTFKSVARKSFINLPKEELRKNIFLPDYTQVSKNRLGFAIQNLKVTHKPQPNNAEELKEVIQRFTCHYWKIHLDPTNLVAKDAINTPLENCESSIISDCRDRLPLNDEFNASTDPNRGHYHYNPQTLIEVEGEDFKKLSNAITQGLINTFSSF